MTKPLKIKDVIAPIEQLAPLSYQESYDNAGLIIGNPNDIASGVLICLDVVEEVVEEAIKKGVNLIIAHHPIVFKGLKRFNGSNYVERTVMLAIKNDIAIYAAHTNIDSVKNGVSSKIADLLHLKNQKILSYRNNDLYKLVTYVPIDNSEKVRKALFEAGAGNIGNYDACSFNVEGVGTFRAGENTNPYVGEKGSIHSEAETRIESIFPRHKKGAIINALLQNHPYEEVAYDIYELINPNQEVGFGIIGELSEPEDTITFLKRVKKTFQVGCVRHTKINRPKVKRIAVCGGSGSFLLRNAIGAKADVFITGDFKYHEFFDAENKIIIADIGHYESEQFTKNIFYEIIVKNFPKFVAHISEINSNPINYL